MKKSDIKKILVASAVIAAAAGGGALIYTYYRNKKLAEERAEKIAHAHAYILGGGMSAFAGALYLARDCDFDPSNIHILKSGVYDRGNGATGYIARRGKILNETDSNNFFDLIQNVRSLDIPDLTVCDEILNLYTAKGALRPVTFIDEEKNVTDISAVRLDRENRNNILNLLKTEKGVLLSVPLNQVFGEDFFASSFWKLVSASYGFDRESNAYEFVNALVYMDESLSGTIPSYFDRSEEILMPLEAHLMEMGIDIKQNTVVSDVDFENGRAVSVSYTTEGVKQTVYLNEQDICIMPTDEMAECEALGDFDTCPPKCATAPYALWERLSEKNSVFKNPAALFDGSDKSMGVEFTITLSNRMLPELIDKVTCGSLGNDGIIVLDNSNWKITIAAVTPSHFKDMDDEKAVIWGTATRLDVPGEFVKKPITEASGAEILYELVSCLNLAEVWKDILGTVINVIPNHRLYDRAYLSPVNSKLEIIPTGITNFALSGDFVDGDGSVFTEEFSVTTAKKAAYKLSDNRKRVCARKKIPARKIKRAVKRFLK